VTVSRWMGFALVMCIGSLVSGEEAPNSKILTYLDRHAQTVDRQLAWNASTVDDHNAWRVQFRAKLMELLGEWPERVPLAVKWDEADAFETDAFTRRKVYVQTERDYWSPAYYYVPKGVTGKRPAIMCFHGHSGVFPYIREGTEAEQRKGEEHNLDYAPYFAEHGYVVLAVVQRGWNETRHKEPHSCERLSRAGFLVGKTPIGMRVWDGMRLLDFLETCDEVDASRIAAAGLSVARGLALLPRVRVDAVFVRFAIHHTSGPCPVGCSVQSCRCPWPRASGRFPDRLRSINDGQNDDSGQGKRR